MKDSTKYYLSFFGFPIIVIVFCHLIVRFLNPYTSPYTWVPGMISYWVISFSIVYFDSRKRKIHFTQYLKNTKIKVYLIVLTLIAGFIPLPLFILNFKLLNGPFFLVAWLFVALVNPFFEEIYWRGYLLNHAAKLPVFIKIIYSSTLFTFSHVFIWGVFAVAMRTPELIISVFLMGIIWSIIYYKSKSIVLPYFSHLLVDLFNLSVLAMMNMLPVAIHF